MKDNKDVKEFALNIKLEERGKLQLLGEILQEKSISGFTQKDNFDGVCVRFQLDEKIQNDEELKKKMESERAMKAQERTKRKKLEEELKALKESKGVPEVLTKIPAEVDRIKKEYEEAKVINEQLRKRCGMLEQDLVKAQEGLRCMMEKNDQSEELKEEIGLLKDLIIKLLLEARGVKP